ncbi:MAG: transglycosylase domain-containing protein [Pseudomonadota bacterium]|uniref:transglycosylase domain-containing protein n=1 Tax=unclassified Blastomonas TaxID=2626550 RepID=UPI000829F672|nr:penicillin-binding protein [Blastomonas sp.]
MRFGSGRFGLGGASAADAPWPTPGLGEARNPWLDPAEIDPPVPEPIKPARTRWWWAKRALAALFVLFLILLAWLAITAPLSKSLEPIAPPEITLLAADGTPIARSGAVVEEPVAVDRLPPHVVEAFLAIEDRRFYSHWGIDPRGLARALWSNITGSSVQGGSTITQQLAKISFLTPERSLTRKLREMLIAFWLEAWLTKDEILGRYLSNAYFGDNVYGLRAASLHYFYRQPEKLKPEQAILLAGLVQAPSRFAPTRNWQGASRRAAMVRAAMVDAGYLTQREADALPQPRLDVHERPKLANGTYFADWAMPQARALTEMSHSRLTLTTTLDARLQRAAERIVARSGLGKAQVALVAMRTNGEVVAMVGGKSHAASPFNRATQAKRQPGSTFKLFVYLAALEAGMEPDSVIEDSPITTGSYRPRNAGDRYRGVISLEEAFVHSSNVAAVRLFQKVGSEKVIKQATQLGLKGPFAEGDPSLALGSGSATLLEMTAAYAGVAGNQWPVQPHAFKREEQGWFEWLVDGPDRYSSRVHEQMQDMLRAAVNRGTGRAASLNIPNFGKTGTSQDNRDALFIGYAGDLVVGVWIGNDDNSPMQGIRGGGLPARIWRQFMGEALPGAVPQRRAAPVAPPEEVDPDPVIGPLLEGEIEGQVGGANVRVTPEGLTISGDVGGAPVEVTVDGNGANVQRQRPPPSDPPQ